MTEPLEPTYTLGTHRLVAPEQTLERLGPLLGRCGVTRIAEITRLDEDFEVPTYTAVRPGGLVLQTGNGKGLTKAAAKVSAAMEAIELFHAETPDRSRFVRASVEQMAHRGLPTFLPPRDEADQRFYFSDRFEIDWVQGETLGSGAKVWVPASAAFFIEPTIYQTHTNGLASGNHLVEATLHAIYELLERDALSRVVQGQSLDLQGRCRVVDPASIQDPRLQRIIAKIEAASSQLVLLSVPAIVSIHVFWAVLLNHRPQHAASALVTGAGAHTDPLLATARAITEAIQSRLTIVQSARDDLAHRPSFGREEPTPGAAFRYFAGLEANSSWSAAVEHSQKEPTSVLEMRTNLERLLASLGREGGTAVRVNLQHPDIGLPVVKVLSSTLEFRRQLF